MPAVSMDPVHRYRHSVARDQICKAKSYKLRGEEAFMADVKRGRDWGLPFAGIPGPFNAITDVAGVEVGTTTLIIEGITFTGMKA